VRERAEEKREVMKGFEKKIKMETAKQ